MDYLLKASAVLFIFYACYQLFLQKETFFQANRWFLLAGLIVSCVIPLVVIPVYIEYTVTNTNNFTINYDSLATQVATEEPFDYFQLFIWMYFVGILFFFGKLLVDFLSLKKILKSSTSKTLGTHKLLETNRNITPFSFFDRIVYNPNQFKDDELQHIINHEKVHTQQWHSIDTIMSQLACILFWFNPIVWLYKKALQQNLEFIADQKAQHISLCEKSYQTVLLKTSLQNQQFAFTNNFYTSLIKKRIVMLHKSKSNNLNLLKLFLVLPLLAFFMMSFNTEDVYVEIPLEEEPTMAIFQTQDIEQIFTKDMSDEDLSIIKKKLSNKGVSFNYSRIKRDKNEHITAIKTEFEYNGNSSTYNINSDKAIEPFIFKSNGDSFVVGNFTDKTKKTYTTNNGKTKVQVSGSNKTYEIEEIGEEEGSGLNYQNTENEATKIVYKTKTWTDKDGEKISINASGNSNTFTYRTKSDDPLFVINGKVVKKSLFEDIDSDDIKSINVLKGSSAIEVYGDKGENGVIIMSTKDGAGSKIISNSNSNTLYFNANGKETPLFILNGEEISKKDLEKLNPNSIESIDVIKDSNKTKAYGTKGKNGVIVIRSKAQTLGSGKNKSVIIEVVEEESPYEIETSDVWIVEEIDEDNPSYSIEFIVSKNSTDAFLNRQKNALKEEGIEAKFSKVRRNKAGEITSIKISLDDNNGRKSSASWKEKDQAIPDIVMGKSNDDKLFVRAIGN